MIFSPEVVDLDPRDYLPTTPGIDALVDSGALTDASEAAQSVMRTLRHPRTGDVAVLVFHDELADAVLVRTDGRIIQDVIPLGRLDSTLAAWAASSR